MVWASGWDRDGRGMTSRPATRGLWSKRPRTSHVYDKFNPMGPPIVYKEGGLLVKFKLFDAASDNLKVSPSSSIAMQPS